MRVLGNTKLATENEQRRERKKEGQSDNKLQQYITPRTLTAKLGRTKHDTLLEQFQPNYTILLYTQIRLIQTLRWLPKLLTVVHNHDDHGPRHNTVKEESEYELQQSGLANR